MDRFAKPHNKFMSTLRRPSPSPAVPMRAASTLLIQDGSYLEVLSLKLSEAVSKALSQPPGSVPSYELVAGRRPLPQGRGHALGTLIALELKANHSNPHLYRAILRSLHRPLSVLLTNLSAHLLPLLSSSLFHSSAPTIQNPNPNPTQVHALAIATFAQELLETFDELGLGLDADIRGDGLKSLREGLVSIINRVVGPLVTGIRAELIPVIEALEIPNNSPPRTVTGSKATTIYHPSIVTLQAVMPIYARALAKYTACPASHTILATFLVAAVWKGSVALSHRPFLSTPSSIVSYNDHPPTPPVTPPPGRFTLKLPPSRPPSPSIPAVPASASTDAHALFDLLNMLPRPSEARESTRLAWEAVAEALEALDALSALLDSIHNKSSYGRTADDMASEIDSLTEDIPLLIALPVLLHAYGGSDSASVASLLGLSESEYRKGCLSGIGRAEECAPVIAHRVMHALKTHTDANEIVYRWLQLETAEL